MLTLFETNAFNNQTALFSTINGRSRSRWSAAAPCSLRPTRYRRARSSSRIRSIRRRKGAGYAAVCAAAVAASRRRRATRREPGAERSARRVGVRPAAFRGAADADRRSPSRRAARSARRPAAAGHDGAGPTGRRRDRVRCGYLAAAEVTGVSVTPHGDPKAAGTLRSVRTSARSVSAAAERCRRRSTCSAPTARRTGRRWSGGPPVFQSQISVAPNPNASAAPRPAFTRAPSVAALQPFRALVSCSYASVLSPDDAKARGFDIQPPACSRRGPRPAEPAPGASPRPRGNPIGAGFIDYAPAPGLSSCGCRT